MKVNGLGVWDQRGAQAGTGRGTQGGSAALPSLFDSLMIRTAAGSHHPGGPNLVHVSSAAPEPRLALGARSSLVPQGHGFLGLSPESRWLCLDWPLRGFTHCSLPPTLLPDGLQSLGAGPG